MSSDNFRFFRHYKNKPYRFLGVVRHSETLEKMAFYETLYDNEMGRLWVRPYDMFFENIQVGGVSKARFEKVIPQVIELNSLNEEQKRQIGEVYFEAFGEALNLDKLNGKLSRHEKLFCILIYDQNQLAAFKLGYARNNEIFYSWLSATKPAFRGLGFATEMMHRQHLWCKKNGFKKIETKTRNKFADMITLNLKSGFRITGTEDDGKGDIKIKLEKKIEEKV